MCLCFCILWSSVAYPTIVTRKARARDHEHAQRMQALENELRLKREELAKVSLACRCFARYPPDVWTGVRRSVASWKSFRDSIAHRPKSTRAFARGMRSCLPAWRPSPGRSRSSRAKPRCWSMNTAPL